MSPDAPKAVGPFIQSILTGNTLYASGQLPLDPVTGQLDTLNSKTPPAREAIQVMALPKGAHVEISCIAVKSSIPLPLRVGRG